MQTRHFAIQGLCLCLAVFGLAALSHADTYETPPPPRPIAPTSGSTSEATSATVAPGKDGRLQVAAPTNTQPQQPQQPQNASYMLKAEPRAPLTGYSVSFFAGANVAQEEDLTSVGNTPVSTKSNLAPMGGLKFGYVWPFSDEPIDQFDMETASVGGVRLSGGLETEAFYVRNETEINSAGGPDNIDMNMGFLMLNATLQAQWGDVRIYGGPGIGLAIIGSEDDTQVGLAYQAIAGLDYFLTPEWSLFGEYKYLILDHLEISTPGGNADFDQFGQHIMSFGVRKHF